MTESGCTFLPIVLNNLRGEIKIKAAQLQGPHLLSM